MSVRTVFGGNLPELCPTNSACDLGRVMVRTCRSVLAGMLPTGSSGMTGRLLPAIPQTSLLDAALVYTGTGWKACIFPVSVYDKPPALGKHHGWHDATGNEAQIRKWWAANPHYNIGIALPMSGWLVIDVDPRHGGLDSLATFEREFGLLPPTFTVATGGGGFHYYYRVDPDCDWPTKVAPGIELRRNGYVIAPPSDTRNARTGGGLYTVHDRNGGHEFPPAPGDLIEQWIRSQHKTRIDALPHTEEWQLAKGERNDMITRFMGAMRRYGFTAPELVDMTLAWGPNRVEDFDEVIPELSVIAQSVERYPPDAYGFDAVRISVRVRKQEPVLGDAALIGPIGDWIRAIEDLTETHPAALLAQALCAFGNIIGARKSEDTAPGFTVEDRYHRTSIYVVLVGDSARAGKGDSWSRVEGLMKRVDPRWIMRGGVQTGEGLIDVLKDDKETDEVARIQGEETHFAVKGAGDKRFLVVEEEFGRLLHVSKRQGQVIKEVYSDLWSKGATDKVTSGQKHRVTGATIGFVGHITKPQLDEDFDYVDMMSGFGNRFLWIFTRRTKVLPLAESLPEHQLQEFVDALREPLEFARTEAPAEYTFSDDAWDLWCDLVEKYDRPQHSALLDHLTARARPIVRRLAVIYAVADCSDQLEVEHLHAADVLFDYSVQSVQYIFGDRIGSKLANSVYEKICEHKTGIERSALHAKLSGRVKADALQEVLDMLERRDLVTCKHERKGKRGPSTEIWIPR